MRGYGLGGKNKLNLLEANFIFDHKCQPVLTLSPLRASELF